MEYEGYLKVYLEEDKAFYKLQDAEVIYGYNIASGDKLLIDGIGNLEVYSMNYRTEIDANNNPIRVYTILAGVVS